MNNRERAGKSIIIVNSNQSLLQKDTCSVFIGSRACNLKNGEKEMTKKETGLRNHDHKFSFGVKKRRGAEEKVNVDFKNQQRRL